MANEMSEREAGGREAAWMSQDSGGAVPPGVLVGAGVLAAAVLGIWAIRRSRRRSFADRARESASEVAQETADQARYLYEHRDELAEDALRMAADASQVAQRALQIVYQARDAYDHRDDLMDEVAEASRELQGRYRRIRGRLGL
jgi:hypothetical protein